MTCDNCLQATDETRCRPVMWDSMSEQDWHRCRADEYSCLDGTDCPDYVESCNCSCNELVNAKAALTVLFIKEN